MIKEQLMEIIYSIGHENFWISLGESGTVFLLAGLLLIIIVILSTSALSKLVKYFIVITGVVGVVGVAVFWLIL